MKLSHGMNLCMRLARTLQLILLLSLIITLNPKLTYSYVMFFFFSFSKARGEIQWGYED